MKESVRKFRAKERKLLRLYSLWHETHQEKVRKECLNVLNEILTIEPQFKLRNDFQQAF